MMKLVNLRAAVLVLAIVLATLAIGCSSEPEVIVKEVTVVKEVVKEVVVTATPMPATPGQPPATQGTSLPTPSIPVATPLPTATPEPKIVTKGPTISAGSFHACGLRENGQAVCWGAERDYYDFGQANPPTDERFVTISAGGMHTCGLRADGRAVCWGDNANAKVNPAARCPLHPLLAPE